MLLCDEELSSIKFYFGWNCLVRKEAKVTTAATELHLTRGRVTRVFNLQAYIIDNTIKFLLLLDHMFKHRTDVLLPCLHVMEDVLLPCLHAMENRCYFLMHRPQLMTYRKELLEIMHFT